MKLFRTNDSSVVNCCLLIFHTQCYC